MTFTLDTQGRAAAPPPTTIGITGDDAYLVVRKSSRDPDSLPPPPCGVGKYQAKAGPELVAQFEKLARALSSRDLPPPRPLKDSNILRYDFEWQGRRHSGTYGFGLEPAFNMQLKPLGTLQNMIQSLGRPEIGLKAEIAVVKGKSTLLRLRLINTGREPVVLSGISDWGNTQDGNQSFVVVGVGDPRAGGGIYYLTSSHSTTNGRLHDEEITIDSGHTVQLDFAFPEIEYFSPSSGSRDALVAGRMKVVVLAPNQLKGRIESFVPLAED